MKKYYVGYDNTKKEGERYTLFYLDQEPKSRAEFPDIAYFVGAFWSKRGASYAARNWNAHNSGHYNQTVGQCEKLARNGQI